MLEVITAEDVPSIEPEHTFFAIYPNPTTGNFILEIKGKTLSEQVFVEIYGLQGEKVFASTFKGESKHEFSLSDKSAGLYFIRVIVGDKAKTKKIIKQ